MAHGIYIGMSAASARARQLDQIGDELANADTPGFKAARARFRSYMADRPEGVQHDDKVLAEIEGAGVDLRRGTVKTTGRPLDVLPDGTAFLGVANQDGTTSFTRDGRLTVGINGTLTAAGLPVVTAGGAPIVVPPGAMVTIQQDATVLADGQPLAQLGLFALGGEVERTGHSLVEPKEPSLAVPVNATVRTGEVELSNVPAIDAAVRMVSVQRAFDHAMQAIETYRRLDDKANQIGRVD